MTQKLPHDDPNGNTTTLTYIRLAHTYINDLVCLQIKNCMLNHTAILKLKPVVTQKLPHNDPNGNTTTLTYIRLAHTYINDLVCLQIKNCMLNHNSGFEIKTGRDPKITAQ